MKTLKFRQKLSELILSGEKTTTWQLFDDKNLSEGDAVSMIVWEDRKEFARAELVGVTEKTMGELSDDDWKGHEKFASDDEMYRTYEKYYKREVDKDSPIKIIQFTLI